TRQRRTRQVGKLANAARPPDDVRNGFVFLQQGIFARHIYLAFYPHHALHLVVGAGMHAHNVKRLQHKARLQGFFAAVEIYAHQFGRGGVLHVRITAHTAGYIHILDIGGLGKPAAHLDEATERHLLYIRELAGPAYLPADGYGVLLAEVENRRNDHPVFALQRVVFARIACHQLAEVYRNQLLRVVGPQPVDVCARHEGVFLKALGPLDKLPQCKPLGKGVIAGAEYGALNLHAVGVAVEHLLHDILVAIAGRVTGILIGIDVGYAALAAGYLQYFNLGGVGLGGKLAGETEHVGQRLAGQRLEDAGVVHQPLHAHVPVEHGDVDDVAALQPHVAGLHTAGEEVVCIDGFNHLVVADELDGTVGALF